jgi:hypothetical protein
MDTANLLLQFPALNFIYHRDEVCEDFDRRYYA